MLWLCHACIIENIWINDNYDCHISNMSCLHHAKISRICIVVLRVDILPCDEMLWLLKYLKCVHHVMISKSYFAVLHVDIWWIATITIIQTCNVKFENECQALISSSKRYIMIGIMMGILISSNDFNLSICLLNL